MLNICSASRTKGVAENVHQKYTLGVHQRNHASPSQRIRQHQKLQT
jgi:hypothetical protein